MNRLSDCLCFIQLVFIFCIQGVYAQDVAGTWQGMAFVNGDNLRIVFHIKKDGGGVYSATMDSPDQGARGILVDEIDVNADSLYLDLPSIGGEYSAVYRKDLACFVGELRQHGIKLPLKLFKGDADDLLFKRPQKPVKPYPYHEEEVTVINKPGGDTLFGTFTKPNGPGKFPVVVMITGSGPEDRDETVFGHKPFLIISDYLTRKGFAVLRCDDRGTAKSTGNFGAATADDFAMDTEAQLDYLKTRTDIDNRRIGLIGHSEGGIVAPMVAVKRKEVSFLVLLAAPAIDMFDLLLVQDSLVATADGSSPEEVNKFVNSNRKLFAMMKAAKDSATAADSIDHYLTSQKTPDKVILASIRQLCSSWMRWYIGYDPRLNLKKLTCAVLAINGEKDVQVPAAIDISSIEETLRLSGNKNFKTKILPGLNHLFQRCSKCSVSEYKLIEETIDPVALAEIGDWMAANYLKKKN